MGRGPAAAGGRVLLAVAAPLLVGGLAVGAVGPETALTAWNDQMMISAMGPAVVGAPLAGGARLIDRARLARRAT